MEREESKFVYFIFAKLKLLIGFFGYFFCGLELYLDLLFLC